MGHGASRANTLAKGLKKLHKDTFDLVILDLHLPDTNGLEALREIRKCYTSPEVIIVAPGGNPESAEKAIRNGAWSYSVKAPSMEKLKQLIQRVMDYRQERCQRTVNLNRYGIYGESEALQNCLNKLAMAASCDFSVLITGETGTGKELFSKTIHKNSNRANKRFVIVDCAALPENLVENLLFGHERGAYTGADSTTGGLITQADGGTLFLDEIGELPMMVQKSFLRVLEGHAYRAVGGSRELKSDFRLVAATNRNLDDMAIKGTFRLDLLHRLRGINIELPPLRDCKSDINAMTCKFISRICRKRGLIRKSFTHDFLEALEAYDWPGNVRELIHAIEYSITAAGIAQSLYPRHLPMHIRVCLARLQSQGNRLCAKAVDFETPEDELLPKLKVFRERAMADIEKNYLHHLMSIASNDINQACILSGLSRPRLYVLLKKYDIHRT